MTAAAGDTRALDDKSLTPRFPPVIRESLVRDGVTRPAAGPPSANDRSRLLMQTVGLIPPGHWETRLGATPAQIVAAAGPGRWPRTLLGALSAATARHPDRRWVEAILTHDGLTERHGSLLAQWTPDELKARLTAAVAAEDTAAAVVLLRRWPYAWEEEAARVAIDLLVNEAARPRDTRHGPTLRYLMRAFARACPPPLADSAAEALAGPPASSVWQATTAQFVVTLGLRREIQLAVTSDERRATSDERRQTTAT